ncbi:MAG: hypothetical protein E7454_02380 [Ruminococcaceae bacterium]|nr:hypothetical protein [Oscillospiraceae bacterium]
MLFASDQHYLFYEGNGIMDGIREYVVGVVAAALLCAAVTALAGKKGVLGVSVKFLAGLLMVMAVISPISSISFGHWFGWAEDIHANGDQIVADGEKMAMEAYRESITEQVEAYILDEAKALDCQLQVEVILSNDNLATPKRVVLSGNISPYAKQVITRLLTDELGIAQEEQIWTG